MSFLLGGIDFVTILVSLAGPVHVVAVGLRGLPVSVGAAQVARDVRRASSAASASCCSRRRPAWPASLFVARARGRASAVGRAARRPPTFWWTLAIVTTVWLVTHGQSRAARREPALAADRGQRDAAAPRIPRAVPADCRRGRSRSSTTRRRVEVARRRGARRHRRPASRAGGGVRRDRRPGRSAARAAAHEGVVAMALAARAVRPGRRPRRRRTCWCRWRSCWCAARLFPSDADDLRWLLAIVRLHLLLHRRARAGVPRAAAGTRRSFGCASPSCCCCRWRWCCPTSLYYVVWQPDVLDLLTPPVICSIRSGRSPTGTSSSARTGLGSVRSSA